MSHLLYFLHVCTISCGWHVGMQSPHYYFICCHSYTACIIISLPTAVVVQVLTIPCIVFCYIGKVLSMEKLQYLVCSCHGSLIVGGLHTVGVALCAHGMA